MKIFVLGSTGYIGSALVDYLERKEYDVDAGVLTKSNFERRITPCIEFNLLEKIPSLKNYDTIIHCATPNDITSRKADGGLPLAVSGTHNLLQQAVLDGVRRIIYFSTLQVYGTELTGPVNENTKISCESIYALNHYLGEEVCKYYACMYPLDIVVVRPSNVFGIPVSNKFNRNTLVPFCFVNEAFEKKEIVLRSSGKQNRNFIFLDDLLTKLEFILKYYPKGFNTYNLVSNWETPIIDIAYMVADSFQKICKEKIKVITTSEIPEFSNLFKAESLHLMNHLDAATQRSRMKNVIEKLIYSKYNLV